MKRFLSWLVLILCFYLLLMVEGLAVYLISLVFDELNRLSTVLYWAAIVLGGSTVLGVFGWLLFGGTAIVVKASQLVWKSKAGARYLVLGIVSAITYGAGVVMILANVAPGELSSNIIFCISSVFLAFIGKSTAIDEGGPPSKREILQEKLDKLDAQEQGRHIAEHKKT